MHPLALRRILGENRSSGTNSAPSRGQDRSLEHSDGSKYASLHLRPSIWSVETLGKQTAGQQNERTISPSDVPKQGSDSEGLVDQDAAAMKCLRPSAPSSGLTMRALVDSSGAPPPPGSPASLRQAGSGEVDIATPMSTLWISGGVRRSTPSPSLPGASPMNTSGTCPSSGSDVPETPLGSISGRAYRTPSSRTPPSLPKSAPGRRKPGSSGQSNLQRMARNSRLRMWWREGSLGSSGGRSSSGDMSVVCEQPASVSNTPAPPATVGTTNRSMDQAGPGRTPPPPVQTADKPRRGHAGSPCADHRLAPDTSADLFACASWTQLESKLLACEGTASQAARNPGPGTLEDRGTENGAANTAPSAVALNWTQLEQEETQSCSLPDIPSETTAETLEGHQEPRMVGEGARALGAPAGPTSTDPQGSPAGSGAQITAVEPKESAGAAQEGAIAQASSCIFFRRQLDAFEHADRMNNCCQSEGDDGRQCHSGGDSSCGNDVTSEPRAQALHSAVRPEAWKVFCAEVPNDGYGNGYTRQFIAGTLQGVWQYYQNLQQQEKHLYEVIREGEPCRVYCDLEFSQRANADLDGDALVESLVHDILQRIMDLWGEVLDPARDVLELDSSTRAKFSRHLIVDAPGCAFRSNAAVGQLLQVCLDADPGRYAVRRDDPSSTAKVPFVDMAVYSRNRHFRVYLSSKATKQARLLPTGRFSGAVHCNPKELWLASLVCNIDPNAKVLQKPLCLSDVLAETSVFQNSINCQQVRGAVLNEFDRIKIAKGVAGTEKGGDSLLQQLVPFIEGVATSRVGGLKTIVRSIMDCGDANNFAFNLEGPGSHYCENINRSHKSNHVFFIVDLERWIYAQKCFDPDCRSYRSPWHPLPPLSDSKMRHQSN